MLLIQQLLKSMRIFSKLVPWDSLKGTRNEEYYVILCRLGAGVGGDLLAPWRTADLLFNKRQNSSQALI